MEIIILGSGTLVPSIRRTAPGLAAIIDNEPLLFDSGSGTIYKLPIAGIDYRNINHIFYSHFSHPDHINDLSHFLFAYKYDFPARQIDLNIIGPEGIDAFYKKIIGLYPIFDDMPFTVNINEVKDERLVHNNFTIITKSVSHLKASSIGYRIESHDKIVVYTGDTDYCKAVIELAENADVLISECSNPDILKKDGHLTPMLAGNIASEAGVKRLVLTHFYPVCDDYDVEEEASNVFSGEIIIAEDFMKIEV